MIPSPELPPARVLRPMARESRPEQPPLVLFSGFAVQGPVESVVAPAFSRETGVEVQAMFDATTILARWIREGQRPDVVILASGTATQLVEEGHLDPSSCHDVARVGLGLAVPKGATTPDISTVSGFTEHLLAARSVAYSRAGASGIYLSRLLVDLGIADSVNRSATVIESGYTGETLKEGRADVAIQQLSELAFVPGVHVVGPLPAEIQSYTSFVAAGLAAYQDHSRRPLQQRFIDELTAPAAQAAFVRAGMEILGHAP